MAVTKKKKKVFVVLALIAAAAYYFFFFRKSATDSNGSKWVIKSGAVYKDGVSFYSQAIPAISIVKEPNGSITFTLKDGQKHNSLGGWS